LEAVGQACQILLERAEPFFQHRVRSGGFHQGLEQRGAVCERTVEILLADTGFLAEPGNRKFGVAAPQKGSSGGQKAYRRLIRPVRIGHAIAPESGDLFTGPLIFEDIWLKFFASPSQTKRF
jgi:hypothetical protein